MALTPKAFDVLRYLVERADRLVTQDEILEALWPGTYVNPEGLRKYILEIRKVLGDRPRQPLFIETLSKRGYQFIAKVTEERTLPQSPADSEASGNIVGRDGAIARLHRHLESARTGKRQVIFVTGEAGIGKTTLVDLFQQHAARDAGLLIARGQCIEGFGGTEAYYPMLEAIASLVSRVRDGALADTLARLAPTWLAQFPSLVKPEQRDWLQREILGSTRGRMVREFCEALAALTAKSPLMVILEDLHWADASTLDLISALARRREPAHLVLIGTYRPVDAILSQGPLKSLKEDLLIHHLCHEVAIERLEDYDVAEYLAKEFAHNDFPPELPNLIHHNSGGNALFMATIVREIVQQGLIAQDRGKWTLSAPIQDAYPGIPETLQQVLDAQIEQLSPEEQRILEGCSVAGERFSVWASSAMLGLSPMLLEETCDKLARRQQFIRSIGVHEVANRTASAHYEFTHSLYRQALYRRLSSLHRCRLHLSLGEHLMPFCGAGKGHLASDLAHHFEAGRDYERAARCLMLTAENATSRFSHRDSIQILRHALELIPSVAAGTRVELEIQILQRIGDLHYALGEMSESAVSFESAADRAAGANLQAAQLEALLRLSLPIRYFDSGRGGSICEQALAVARALGDPLLLAQTQSAAVGFRLLCNSWRKEDEEAFAKAQETLRRLGGSSTALDVSYLYVRAIQGEYQEALKQANALILATANPTAYILGLGAKIFILVFLGRLGEALHVIRCGQELAEKNGENPWVFIFCEVWLRWACFDCDRLRQLSAIMMRSNAEQQAAQPKTIAAIAAGYAALYQDKPDAALESFSEAFDSRNTPGFFMHWYWRLHARLGIAEARLQAGDVAHAQREAQAFLDSALSSADPTIHALAWEVKARVARAAQDRDGARECVENALSVLDRSDVPAAAWRVYAAAVDLYSESGEPLKAEEYRARAKAAILRLQDSFEPGEPLRQSLIGAAPVRHIFGRAATP